MMGGGTEIPGGGGGGDAEIPGGGGGGEQRLSFTLSLYKTHLAPLLEHHRQCSRFRSSSPDDAMPA